MAKFQRLVPIVYVTDLESQLRFTPPELYWERMDAWEMKVWSPNGYRINLEGHRPRPPA